MKEERYSAIMKILETDGFASVECLSKKLYVSMPTIRRDLTVMQEIGLIQRSHGGAVSKNSRNGSPLPFRMGVNTEAKRRMCARAADLLRDNCMIFMDESSTTAGIINYIHNYKNICIVTNSMAVLQRAYSERIPAYCIGGELAYETMSFLGSAAEEAVMRYGIDIMFFSSSGISRNSRIVDYFEPANSLRRAAAKCAETRVFLCDKTKFGKNQPYTLMSLADADWIITDEPLPDYMDTGNAVTVAAK